MSFRVDTPIGLLPYAVTPTGEVQFLLWKAETATPSHSSKFFGDCIGVKDRHDSTMWDVCARTWAECSGGLFAISEEFRKKRENREKKELKALQAGTPTTATSIKESKKDKKEKKKDSSSSKYPSIMTYTDQQQLNNEISSTSPNSPASIITLFANDSKKYKHFELIYQMYTPAQLVYNSTKAVRKILTSRHSSVITLTNDNMLKPKFVYCIPIEYLPLWLINYVVKQNGHGECTWVSAYELIKYGVKTQLASIPQDYKDSIAALNPETASNISEMIATATAEFKLYSSIEQECVIEDESLWEEYVEKYFSNTNTTKDKTSIKKVELTQSMVTTAEASNPALQALLPHDVPFNLPLSAVLTVDSLIKLINLCNSTYESTISSPLFNTTSYIPAYIHQYSIPPLLTKYHSDITYKINEPTDPTQKKIFALSTTQKQTFSLDIQLSNGYYKCKQCRNILFTTRHLEDHTQFDLKHHIHKAQLKFLQQQQSSNNMLKKQVIESKQNLSRIQKTIIQQVTLRKVREEIAAYGEKILDGESDYENLDEDDDDEDFEHDFEIDFDDFAMDVDQEEDDDIKDGVFDDEEDEELYEAQIGLNSEEILDPSLLISFKQCYSFVHSQNITDQTELDLRNMYMTEFYRYKDLAEKYYHEKAKQPTVQLSHDDAAAPGHTNVHDDENAQTLMNFAQEKGKGIYVKPIFGKASYKGFSGANDAVCQSLFLMGNLEQLPPTISDMRDKEGDLQCNYCCYRFGQYNWSGKQCSCGQWVVPGIQVPISKVDFVEKRKLQTIGADATGENTSSDQAQAASVTTTQGPTKIIGVRRLAATRPPVRKPGQQ